MNIDDAQRFVAQWVGAWNSHDLESILTHFSDDVTFSSPLATKIVPESQGVIEGEEALRHYWREGLGRTSDLHFDVEGVSVGIEALVIHYRNQDDRRVSEVQCFDGALVSRGLGTYLGAYLDDGSSAAGRDTAG
jgi:hypothetical protein